MRIAERIGFSKAYTPAQHWILDKAADDHFKLWEEYNAWWAARPLAEIARKVIERTKNLVHVNKIGLQFLTADDIDLLNEAKRLVQINRSRSHKGIFVHPRDRDAASIRRRLRCTVGRAAIHTAAILGIIGGPERLGLPSYADDWTVRRFERQKAANRRFLCEHVIVAVDGSITISMADVAESAANARRSMWYAFIMGMRDIARRDRLVPIFVSMTLPPEWHLHPQYGTPGDASHSPAEGSREIGRRWHGALAQFKKRGGYVLGVRVAEPHKDATVHLHAVVWVAAELIPSFSECLGHHFPSSTAKESDFRNNNNYGEGPALVVRRWEERKGDDPRGAADAASYALSYILDVLASGGTVSADDVEGVETSEKRRADMDAMRPAAWARHVRLRQISLVGLAPGTIGRWEAFYRLKRNADRDGVRIEQPFARSVAHAMRRGQWGTVLRLLGALRPGNRPQLKSLLVKREDRWGDIVSVNTGFFKARTGEIVVEFTPGAWKIAKVANSLNVDTLSDIDSYPSRGPPAHPPPVFSG